MQLGRNEICKMVQEENPEFDLDFLLELDKFIFSTLRKKTSNPTSLIYNLAPLGKWTYRKAKVVNTFNKCEEGNELSIKIKMILDMYEIYVQDKLEKKYEIFGKESHESYILAKKQERLQKWQENKSKERP